MNALGALPGVVVPASNVHSPDNELIHHQTIPLYQQLRGRGFSSSKDLINFFYQYNREAQFAGFKSMPRRHGDYAEFIQRPDIQFITLDRRDVFATLASFIAATKHNTWRRTGGVPPKKLRYEESDARQLELNLRYIATARQSLLVVPNAIPLFYEDLCQPQFRSARLDAYFEQPVILSGAKPPTQTRDYLENDVEFRAAVEQVRKVMREALPAEKLALLDSIPPEA
jgi:hypothetical protein